MIIFSATGRESDLRGQLVSSISWAFSLQDGGYLSLFTECAIVMVIKKIKPPGTEYTSCKKAIKIV
jgi:hypothetical protein